tara:strand:- start:182 stop:457 length:276 start_codon:yes stop_codon:yes gene_type:complete
MSKTCIVDSVASTLNTSHKNADDMVSIVLDSIKQGIKEGGVVIRGFGRFSTKRKTKRAGRNPKTGAPAVIKARRVVKFKASKLFKDKLNKN